MKGFILRMLYYFQKSDARSRRFLTFFLNFIFFLAFKNKVSSRLKKSIPILNSTEVDRLARTNIYNSVYDMVNAVSYKSCCYRIDYCLGDDNQLEGLRKMPGIIVSLHMGFADLLTVALNQSNIPTYTMIGHGGSSPELHELGVKILKDLDVPFLRKSPHTFFDLIALLKKGNSIVLHSDLRGKGTKVNFMGYETEIPDTAVKLSLLLSIPLYYGYVDVRRNGIHGIKIKLLHKGGAKSEEGLGDFLCQNIATEMESTILDSPENWFWLYDRFKGIERSN